MKLTDIAAVALDEFGDECRAKNREECPYHGVKRDQPDAAVANSSSGVDDRFRSVSPMEFHKAITAARNSRPEDDRWRVDAKPLDEYEKMPTLLVSQGGSCVAVKENGDIVSACRHINDKSVRGGDILRAAFSHGGTKLDSFDGNWDFYTRNGLHPVSWTPFDERYKPDDWREGVDEKEPVVFFVAEKTPYTKPKGVWYNSVSSSPDYDSAEKERDEHMKGRK